LTAIASEMLIAVRETRDQGPRAQG